MWGSVIIGRPFSQHDVAGSCAPLDGAVGVLVGIKSEEDRGDVEPELYPSCGTDIWTYNYTVLHIANSDSSLQKVISTDIV